MERKLLLTAALSTLIFLASIQLYSIKFIFANPYDPHMYDHVEVPALSNPKITVLYPAENNSLVNSSNLTISLEATMWIALIGDIYYKPSWLSNNFTVFPDENNVFLFRGENFEYHEYSGNLSFTDIPEGDQNVTITVEGHGDYTKTVSIPQEYPWDPSTGTVCYYWSSRVECTVYFVVDTVPPQVSVLDLDNKAFSVSEVPLDFIINETTSKIIYSLDGQENVTITGNTTLTGLSSGAHALTVYAADEAGNVGSSQIISFSIVLFPTEVVLASVIIIPVVVLAVFLLMRKHKH